MRGGGSRFCGADLVLIHALKSSQTELGATLLLLAPWLLYPHRRDVIERRVTHSCSGSGSNAFIAVDQLGRMLPVLLSRATV